MSDTFDPFAVLHAIEQHNAEPASGTAEPADPFAGSEPVAAEPAAAPASSSAEPAAAATDVSAAYREAILALEARIAAIEQLARRNGWPL